MGYLTEMWHCTMPQTTSTKFDVTLYRVALYITRYKSRISGYRTEIGFGSFEAVHPRWHGATLSRFPEVSPSAVPSRIQGKMVLHEERADTSTYPDYRDVEYVTVTYVLLANLHVSLQFPSHFMPKCLRSSEKAEIVATLPIHKKMASVGK